MGNPFSIPCNPCVDKFFHCLDERVAYIHHLEKNLVALEKAIGELKAKREDLLRWVKREEDKGLQSLAEVQVWLTNAENTEIETDELLRTRDVELQRLCLCGFCSKRLRLRSSCRYGKKVILALREVGQLQSRVFEVVAEQPQTSVVQEIPPPRIIVGQEKMLDEAWKRLLEDDVGTLGMYGMGGVGKTTLLKQLNNKFSKERCGFDFVIWVVVSKPLNLENIRDEIARIAGIGGKTKEAIYNFLKKKRFVLFLDDLWEKVDLAEIGVPFPTVENKCKVAFTTRSRDVCARMQVEKPMKVQCLTDKEAFDLFQKKVGKTTLESDPEIPDLARIIAGKCYGLPLALDVIGETMSCKMTRHEWYHAIDVLNEYAREFSDMEDKILPLLKYSYDDLKEEKIKSCLLYCALFPEDHKIFEKGLIEYWICEGMIDGSKGIERANNKGYEIIASLVSASLLMEEYVTGIGQCVYMHDVVREMALWIASNLGNQNEAFIVRAGVGLREMPKVANWSAVKKMSMMENKIRNLDGGHECPELTTLLLSKNDLEKISSEFFNSMPKLSVLDLSENRSLSELPYGISELVSLQYLDLSRTGIRHLPMEGQGLKNLIYLALRETNKLSSLVGISNLHNLKVVKLYDSSFPWDLKIVEELETLEHLEVLTLGIEKDPPSLERYFNSPKLASCTLDLRIADIDMGSSGCISLPVTMEKLSFLFIRDCSIFEIKIMVCNPRSPCFLSLSDVYIDGCKFLRELTFLMFAPNLKHLDVRRAYQLEDIINKEKACEGGESGIVPFPKLMEINLEYLPKLKSIYWKPLPFPCLKEITVDWCPNLRNLPLDSQSGAHDENERYGLSIFYKRETWNYGTWHGPEANYSYIYIGEN